MAGAGEGGEEGRMMGAFAVVRCRWRVWVHVAAGTISSVGTIILFLIRFLEQARNVRIQDATAVPHRRQDFL